MPIKLINYKERRLVHTQARTFSKSELLQLACLCCPYRVEYGSFLFPKIKDVVKDDCAITKFRKNKNQKGNQKMPTEKLNGNFFIVPNSIFQKKLKPRDFAVYCCLTMHSDKNGYCYPSRRLIAEECSIDRKTVDTAIGNLLELGLIEKANRSIEGKKTSNRYRVLQ